MDSLSLVYVSWLILSVLLPLVNSHARFMTTQCTTPLEVGTEIMYAGPAILSDQIAISVSRDNVTLNNNSFYVPGEWLSVSLTLPSDTEFFEYVYETSNGAVFINTNKVGCDNRRIHNTAIATLQMPIVIATTTTNAFEANSNELMDIAVWVGGCNGVFAAVEISNKFILKVDPSIINNINPTLLPSSEPTPLQTSISPSVIHSNSSSSTSNATVPTILSTISPTIITTTISPTSATTSMPSSIFPSYTPSIPPTTDIPSTISSETPSFQLSFEPSFSPSIIPSSLSPTYIPSFQPSSTNPTFQPSSIKPTKISSSASSSITAGTYKYQFIIAVFFSSLTICVLLSIGLYYWWKYAKARKLATDVSKIKNDRYRSYYPTNNYTTPQRSGNSSNNNTSGGAMSNMFSNMTRRYNRSSSLDSSDDDTTSILMWDRKHSNPAHPSMNVLVPDDTNNSNSSNNNGGGGSVELSSNGSGIIKSSSINNPILTFNNNNHSTSPQSNMILLGGRFTRSPSQPPAVSQSHPSPAQYTTLNSVEHDE